MYLLSRLQKYAGMGRLVSAVTGFAALKGSSVFLTQMLRVLLSGLRKAMYFPSGEICAPEISGSPKNNSRSMSGGRCACVAGGRMYGSVARIQKTWFIRISCAADLCRGKLSDAALPFQLCKV